MLFVILKSSGQQIVMKSKTRKILFDQTEKSVFFLYSIQKLI